MGDESWPSAADERLARRWLAELVFDSASRHSLDAVGTRGTRPAWRRLVFAAGPFELDLRLVRSAYAHPEQVVYAVGGQLLGPCTGNGRVSLSRLDAPDPTRAEVGLNSICEFEFRAVPAGRYALTVDLADDSVRILALQIGH